MPSTARRATTVGAGASLSGALSLLGLVVVQRALGAAAAPVAVAWALAVVVGPGWWQAVEREAARLTPVDGSPPAGLVRHVLRRAVLTMAATAALGLLLRDLVLRGSIVVPLALAVVAGAYGPLHLAWGVLAARRRAGALAGSLAVEGALRLALAGGAAALGLGVAGAAVGLAAAVIAAAAVSWRACGIRTASAAVDGTSGRPLGDLVLTALLSQALVLGGPAVLEALAAGDPRSARLATALVLARAPSLAWRGVTAALIPDVGAATSAERPIVLARAGAGAALVALAGAALGMPVAVLAGDAAITLLVGPGTELGAGAMAVLSGGTAAALGAATATAALAGAGRDRPAAAAWVVAGAAAGAALLLPLSPLARVLGAVVAGPVVALVGTVGATGALRRAW